MILGSHMIKLINMVLACVMMVALGGIPLIAAEPLQFNRDIRPILSEHCFSCHGQGKQKGELRLDSREAALKVAASGEPAIQPAKPEASHLVERIFSQEKGKVMPPPSTKKNLTQAQKETLKEWVRQGAGYEKHWAFEPFQVKQPANKTNNPIDGYLLSGLKKHHLGFSSRADKSTLLRRVAFTLTGLPHSVEEVDAFLNDNSTNASRTGLSVGTYSVTVTDVNSCTATYSKTLVATNPSPVTPTTIKH